MRKSCYICLDVTNVLDSHHIWPQFAGGEAGPVVDLCSRCHSALHRQAVNLASAKAKRRAYFPPDQMERARPLIQFLVMAITQAKEQKTGNRRILVTMELDANFVTLLHMLKMDAGHSNLGAFCASVLREYARGRI